MLSLVGFLAIATLLTLVLTNKTSIHFALVIVPIVAALIVGVDIESLGEFMASGLSSIAPTGIMLAFAVLFFGIMYDAGLFDPIIKGVIKISKGDPVKIAVGTSIIAFTTQLDGSGSSTYLITVSALLPVYLALKMSPLVLAVITGLGAGIMNLVPWGGPTIRAATSLDIDVMDLWVPMIPVQIVGMLAIILVSAWLGLQEKKKIGNIEVNDEIRAALDGSDNLSDEEKALRRPKLFWINLLLTIAVITVLVMGLIPLSVVFVIAVPLALMLNYGNVKEQQQRIEAHAKGAIYTASVIFSAGIFIGIFSQTGMIEAMATSLASGIPDSWGGFFPYILAVLSVPLTILFDPDSFYFGVLPVLTSTAEVFGVDPMSMGRAAIIGQTTLGSAFSPLIGSTWLLIGLAGVHMGDMQKKGLPLAFGIAIVMTITAVLLGSI